MKFTEEHIEVLERHKAHWETLRAAGFMRNLDRSVFDELQNVHNEAVGPAQYTHWCGSCVADMVRILYTNYEKWLSEPKQLTPEDQAEIEQRFADAFRGYAQGGRKRKRR